MLLCRRQTGSRPDRRYNCLLATLVLCVTLVLLERRRQQVGELVGCGDARVCATLSLLAAISVECCQCLSRAAAALAIPLGPIIAGFITVVKLVVGA